MATHNCTLHTRRKAEALCMGCGQWYCSSCLTKVKQVPYCKKCAETIGEDLRALKEQMEMDDHSPATIRRVAAGETDEWEKAFRSSEMIRLTRRRLRALKRPIDLGGAVAGVGRRTMGTIIDWAVLLVLVAGAYLGIASLMVARPGVSDLDPAVGGASLLIGLAAGFLVRFFMLSFAGQTIGGLLAGIKLVDLRGKPARAVLCFGRALFDTVFDVLFPVHALDVLLVNPKKKRGSLSDRIVGTQAVAVAAWRAKAQDTIYQEDRAKLMGAEG